MTISSFNSCILLTLKICRQLFFVGFWKNAYGNGYDIDYLQQSYLNFLSGKKNCKNPLVLQTTVLENNLILIPETMDILLNGLSI